MIRLITGLPGHGKTLWAVSEVIKKHKSSDRKIVFVGFNELDRKQFDNHVGRIFCVGYEQFTEWKNKFPKGALVIVDEAQEAMPQRQKRDAPAFITDLSTHRHHGLDIWLITQDPRLLDAWARRLVDEHFHIKRLWGTSVQVVISWDKVCDTPRDRREQRHAVKKLKVLEKKYFGVYKSSVIHNVEKRVPVKVYAGVAFILAFPIVGYFLLGEVLAFVGGKDEVEEKIVESSMQGVSMQTPPREVDRSAQGEDSSKAVVCRTVGTIFGRVIVEVIDDGETYQVDGQRLVALGIRCGRDYAGIYRDFDYRKKEGVKIGLFAE